MLPFPACRNEESGEWSPVGAGLPDDPPPPERVTGRGLHLQDLGPGVDPELGAVAAGQRGREVQHTEAFQRTRHSTP